MPSLLKQSFSSEPFNLDLSGTGDIAAASIVTTANVATGNLTVSGIATIADLNVATILVANGTIQSSVVIEQSPKITVTLTDDVIGQANATFANLADATLNIQTTINTAALSLQTLSDVNASSLSNGAMLKYDSTSNTFVFITEINQPQLTINGGNF